MEENIEILSIKNLGRTLPIKFIGYKWKIKKVDRKFLVNELYEVEMCKYQKEMLCPSGRKYKFIKGQTKLIPVMDAEFLLRFKDMEGNYCFKVDM